MYLEHFKLTKSPFALTPNTEFYCELPGHQEALNVLLISLQSGEGFIKIVGEVGTGKTLLCRLLLNKLDENYVTAYIPNPDLTPDGLRVALAHELGLDTNENVNQHQLLERINERLLQHYQSGKRVVLLVDEAQAMSEQSLEALRLFTNLETQSAKLLQVVLFGQPELDSKLNAQNLRQLKQRITFSYYLNPLKEQDLNAYLCHRLAMAGFTYGSLFTRKAKTMLYRASKGLPRLVNILCHKAMLAAYGKGQFSVDHKAILRAVDDTESADLPASRWRSRLLWFGATIVGVSVVLILYWKLGLLQ